jgi:hypothetical protein
MSAAFPRAGAINAVNTNSISVGQPWLSVASGAGVYVAVGGVGSYLAGVSVDGAYWDVVALPTTPSQYRSVAYGANIFVAMGADSGAATTAYATSVDGYNWVARTLPTAAIVSNIIWSKELSLFVASCGYNPNSNAPANVVLTSIDGLTWKYAALTSSRLWTAVASGTAGLVVLCTDQTEGGPGVALSSTDGVTFTQRTMPGGHWTSVVYGRGLYVAVGYKQVSSVTTPIIATSPDGVVWTLVSVPGTTTGVSTACVGYGDGSFVAVWNGFTMVSYDGLKWIKKNSLMSQPPPGQICYGSGFFIVGYGSSQYTMINVTVENFTDSAWMYVSGTSGKYVRVR